MTLVKEPAWRRLPASGPQRNRQHSARRRRTVTLPLLFGAMSNLGTANQPLKRVGLPDILYQRGCLRTNRNM
jgi:hypothetical protein